MEQTNSTCTAPPSAMALRLLDVHLDLRQAPPRKLQQNLAEPRMPRDQLAHVVAPQRAQLALPHRRGGVRADVRQTRKADDAKEIPTEA